MAGISQGVLVIEAGERSGTLITSRLATEYNRDVYAVPGSIFSYNSKGVHRLIAQGAAPVTRGKDLLTALGFETVSDIPKQNIDDCSPEEKKILELLFEPLPRDEIVRALRQLKGDETLNLNYMRSLTAVDNEEEGIDIVYHLYSTENHKNLTVKTTLQNDDLNLDTATTVYRAANWLERETAEMFGVRFAGHPDPRTLLMPEDMTDTFPLRKSHPLAEIEVLQGEGMGYTEESD